MRSGELEPLNLCNHKEIFFLILTVYRWFYNTFIHINNLWAASIMECILLHKVFFKTVPPSGHNGMGLGVIKKKCTYVQDYYYYYYYYFLDCHL